MRRQHIQIVVPTVVDSLFCRTGNLGGKVVTVRRQTFPQTTIILGQKAAQIP